MKTIVTCALLAALAFGLLPGMEQQWIPEDDGLVLLVETDAAQNEAAQSVSGAADDPDPAEALDNRTVRLLAGEEILELSMEEKSRSRSTFSKRLPWIWLRKSGRLT